MTPSRCNILKKSRFFSISSSCGIFQKMFFLNKNRIFRTGSGTYANDHKVRGPKSKPINLFSKSINAICVNEWFKKTTWTFGVDLAPQSSYTRIARILQQENNFCRIRQVFPPAPQAPDCDLTPYARIVRVLIYKSKLWPIPCAPSPAF